jgi:hypothetical protein
MKLWISFVLAAGIIAAQTRYSGPVPPKADVPFLLHASNLIETEVTEARQGEGKDGTVYTIPGAVSQVRTPMAEPIFLFKMDRINPDKLSLFRMEVKNGQRLLSMPSGKKARNAPKPVFLIVNRLAQGLFKVEVNEFLENGQYCLSPDGSNQVFCFEAY